MGWRGRYLDIFPPREMARTLSRGERLTAKGEVLVRENTPFRV
jgi:hypothetical protein